MAPIEWVSASSFGPKKDKKEEKIQKNGKKVWRFGNYVYFCGLFRKRGQSSWKYPMLTFRKICAVDLAKIKLRLTFAVKF